MTKINATQIKIGNKWGEKRPVWRKRTLKLDSTVPFLWVHKKWLSGKFAFYVSCVLFFLAWIWLLSCFFSFSVGQTDLNVSKLLDTSALLYMIVHWWKRSDSLAATLFSCHWKYLYWDQCSVLCVFISWKIKFRLKKSFLIWG